MKTELVWIGLTEGSEGRKGLVVCGLQFHSLAMGTSGGLNMLHRGQGQVLILIRLREAVKLWGSGLDDFQGVDRWQSKDIRSRY